MAAAGLLESWLLAATDVTSGMGIALVVALTEEALKLVAVLGVAGTARRFFNDPLDGLVYGSLAGLGMAIEESLFYLQHGPRGPATFPAAELARICGHLVMGGIGAFGLGMAAVGRRGWPWALAGGWAAAVGLHFAWDTLALAAADAGGMDLRSSLSAVAIMVAGLVLYGGLTAMGSAWSHRLFAPEAPARLWGWPFVRKGRKI
jgi:RsiW-degrading membrane proteinase PrsW (M82 family)